MKNDQIHSNCQESVLYLNKIDQFFKKFNIKTILNRSRIRKEKGIHPSTLLAYIMALPFVGSNFFQGIVQKSDLPFAKDAAYDLLKSEKHNWRRFILTLSVKIIELFDALTRKEREKVMVIDESSIERPRSKVVELLARVFDHCEHKYLRGFRFLNLSWSDGASFIPIDFALLTSKKASNRYQGITKELDKRTCGYKRRQEALCKSSQLIEPMVARALKLGIKAQYVLMDSGFSWPVLISKLRQHIHVICMVKDTPKILYTFGEKRLTLSAIYRRIKKRPGKAKILGSVIVTMNDGLLAKIVFVRNRNTRGWLAILSTNIDLPDEEIVRIYGKRWDIEVFFKMAKQFLGLEKGIQARDFDSLIAHASIVILRYQFLALEQRRQEDPRTFGALFRACCQEMKDLSFMEALSRILSDVLDRLRQAGEYAEEIYQAVLSTVYAAAIDFFGFNEELYQTS